MDRSSIDSDLQLLAMARLGFTQRLELVGADDWKRPTPCTDWNVRQLVNHVVGSDVRYTDLLRGGSAEDFIRRREDETRLAPVGGGDALEEWRHANTALDAALHERGAMDRVVDYPRGPLRGHEIVENRLVDITIHTWDLARAIAADDTLDERLVRRCLSAPVFESRIAEDSGVHDPAALLTSTARLQERLLRASGRSPS
jgi:uncharacterized protein (TIGR03086 family)